MHKSISIFFILFHTSLFAQDSTSNNSKLITSGYIKSVETIYFDKINQTNTTGHLIHNRLNYKWKPNNDLFFVGELRNRFFYGEAGSENQKPIFKSSIERLYADYQKNKFSVRLGRQRVNWGIATIWNPNDILNAYNFLDVDYEERPGTDAVKLQYTTNEFSHIELVQSGFGKNQITAGKIYLNKNGYDYQLIAGLYKGNPTLGMGWAGNIKDAGFKGEAQYYFNNIKSLRQLNLTLGIDYMFKNAWYLNTGVLYNSNGLDSKIVNGQLLDFQLSAKNLMPTKYNLMVMAQKEINPLSAIGLTMVYAPRVDLFILMPSFRYSIATNLDLDLIWQSFYLNRQSKLRGLSELGFFRLRWSFGNKN